MPLRMPPRLREHDAEVAASSPPSSSGLPLRLPVQSMRDLAQKTDRKIERCSPTRMVAVWLAASVNTRTIWVPSRLPFHQTVNLSGARP
jgi:hypothetical protein